MSDTQMPHASETREEPTFFGRGDQQLFGILHVPGGEPIGGVVIASPVHEEMVKNYRKEVLLARALAHRGIAAQRFHYRGTGHSDGDGHALTFDTMLEDFDDACEHLRASTGVEHFALVGTRLGGLVALHANRGADPIALWEPIVDPQEYAKDVNRMRLMRAAAGRGSAAISLREELTKASSVDVMGYEWTTEFLEGLLARGVDSTLAPPDVLLVQLRRRTTLDPDYLALVQQWQARGSRVDTFAAPVGGTWWFEIDARTGEWTHSASWPYIDATCDWIVRRTLIGRV